MTLSPINMQANPLVYIIMPNYNGADYLKTSISSIINQSYQNWKLLIVDDSSTDNSVEIIKGFREQDNRISYYVLKENAGCPAIPRNIGLKMAEGDYVAFIDSDDIWHSEKLKLQISIALNEGYNFVATGVCHFVDEDAIFVKPIEGNFANIPIKKYSHRDMLFKNRIISGSSALINLSLIRDNGLFFKEDIRYRAVEDYLFWLKLLELTEKCVLIDLPLVFYRHSLTSISKSKLPMAKKVFMLLSEYEYNDGKRIGLERFVYFSTYAFLSMMNRIFVKRCGDS